MRIDGVCCCVGPLYAGYLRRTLPVWLKTLDSLTIMYADYDFGIGLVEYESFANRDGAICKVRTLATDAFRAANARFNKGAALNVGLYSITNRAEWILSVDCDVFPQENWRELAEPQLQAGNLYGAKRYTESGKPEDSRFYPRGYFQLWHASDPTYRRSPIFDDWHKHAGHYDTSFADQWPAERQIDLGFKLTHLGQKARHWYGPGADPALMEEALREWREMRREAAKR